MPRAELQGVTLQYEVAGEGTPVLFVPGFATNMHLFDHQVAPVSQRFEAVRFDLRGHGKSSSPPAGYATQDYAADIIALMEHLNLPRAHFVAASMGGGIAVHLALRRPDLVRSLVLAGAVVDGYDGWPQEYGARLRRARKVARSQGVAPALAEWRTHPFFGATRDMPRFARDVLEFSGAPWLQDTWPPAPDRTDFSRLGELEVPTLVIVGALDVAPCLAIAEELGRAVAGARREVIQGAGHLPCWDRPEEFDRLLLHFLSLQGSPPG